MRKIKWHNILPCAVIVICVVAGLILLHKSMEKYTQYTTTLSAARQALTEADPTKADAPEAELAALLEENAALEATVEALQEENAELDAQTEELQQEYDALSQEEDTVYYQTILDSLTEGMNKVEGYINGDE